MLSTPRPKPFYYTLLQTGNKNFKNNYKYLPSVPKHLMPRAVQFQYRIQICVSVFDKQHHVPLWRHKYGDFVKFCVCTQQEHRSGFLWNIIC